MSSSCYYNIYYPVVEVVLVQLYSRTPWHHSRVWFSGMLDSDPAREGSTKTISASLINSSGGNILSSRPNLSGLSQRLTGAVV